MNKPHDYPDIIYKYRNWNDAFHKNVLIENNLYLASPKYFNDPFDCRIPTNFYLLDSPEKIHEYAVSFVNRNRDFLLSKNCNLQHEIELIKNDFTNRLDVKQRNHEKILFEKQDKHYGVLSLSKRWNSILMWSHYANNHTGYCVGLWEEKIRNSNSFGKGGPVGYNPENDYPVINPLDYESPILKGFKETHSKSNEWSYKDEYRLTRVFFPDEPTDFDRTIKVPDNFFAEIVIGLLTPESHKREIIEIARNKKIPVFQAKKVPFKFEIIREEIAT